RYSPPGPSRALHQSRADGDAGHEWDNHAQKILDDWDSLPYHGGNSFDKAYLRKRSIWVVGALDASMYELLVLSLLMHWPLHAYRIAKIANDIVGPEERISTGTLSTLIGKLTHAGLITAADATMTPFPSDRASQVLAITPAGRERFLDLM